VFNERSPEIGAVVFLLFIKKTKIEGGIDMNVEIKINDEAESYIRKIMEIRNISFNEAVERVVNNQSMREYQLVRDVQKAVENAKRKSRF